MEKEKWLIVAILAYAAAVMVQATQQFAVFLGVIHLTGISAVLFALAELIILTATICHIIQKKAWLRRVAKIGLLMICINNVVNMFSVILLKEELLAFVQAHNPIIVSGKILLLKYVVATGILCLIYRKNKG